MEKDSKKNIRESASINSAISRHFSYKNGKITLDELKRDEIWNGKLALCLIEKRLANPESRDMKYITTQGIELKLYTKNEFEEARKKYYDISY